MVINSLKGFYDESHKAEIVLRAFSRGVKKYARVGRERPVVVLS